MSVAFYYNPLKGNLTRPVCKVINDGAFSRLVDFFDVEALANEVCELLDNSAVRVRLETNVGAFVQFQRNLKTICLPQQLQWTADLEAS